MGSRDPVYGSFHLAAAPCSPALCLRVIGAMQLDRFASVILHSPDTFDDVRISQSHLTTRSETEEFLRRAFHEIVPLDVKHARKRHFSRPHTRVFRIIDRIHLLYLPFGVIVDNHADGLQHSHNSPGTLVQVLSDTMLQQRNIYCAVRLGHADTFAEISDGRRPVAPPARP